MCEQEAGYKILLLLFVFCEKQVRRICLCFKKKGSGLQLVVYSQLFMSQQLKAEPK